MSPPNYDRIFGADVALGLGLVNEPPQLKLTEVLQEYQDDPASAFTRAAAYAQPPGDSVPVPFASVVTPANPTRD